MKGLLKRSVRFVYDKLKWFNWITAKILVITHANEVLGASYIGITLSVQMSCKH